VEVDDAGIKVVKVEDDPNWLPPDMTTTSYPLKAVTVGPFGMVVVTAEPFSTSVTVGPFGMVVVTVEPPVIRVTISLVAEISLIVMEGVA